MNRSEYLDFILRLAQAAYPRTAASVALTKFIETYLKPIVHGQTMIEDRKRIHDRAALNKLLFLNKHGLRYIWSLHKAQAPSQQFTLASAITMFEGLGPSLKALSKSPTSIKIDPNTIRECFLFSQMTVQDESRQSDKYHYLHFGEFLEFLCHFALEFVKCQETIEQRVYYVMEAVYRREDILTSEQAALVSPDIDIQLVDLAGEWKLN